MEKKYGLVLCVLLFICIFMSGCAVLEPNPNSLMSPPSLEGERDGVWTTLKSIVPGDIKMCYPSGGKYRDALILQRFFLRGSNTAIVMYFGSSQMVRVAILEKENDEWMMISDISTGASGVDFVEFSEDQLIMGYNISQRKEKQIVVYSLGSGKAMPIYENTYEAISFSDFDSNGIMDFFMIKNSNDQDRYIVEMASSVDGIYTILSRAYLSEDITAISQTSIGKTGYGQTALFVDGKSGQSTWVTQVILANGAQIYNILDNPKLSAATQRYQPIFTTVDDYGISYIPTQSILSGYESSREPEYITKWVTCYNNELRHSKSSFISQSLGFSLDIPNETEGKITFRYAYQNSRLEILEATEKPIEDNDNVLAVIGVFTKEDMALIGFTKIGEVGITSYGMMVYPTRKDSPGFQSEDVIRRQFSILGW